MPRPRKPAKNPRNASEARPATRPDVMLRFNIPSNHDVETVKAELRLIRSDLVSLEKKLPALVETKFAA